MNLAGDLAKGTPQNELTLVTEHFAPCMVPLVTVMIWAKLPLIKLSNNPSSVVQCFGDVNFRGWMFSREISIVESWIVSLKTSMSESF